MISDDLITFVLLGVYPIGSIILFIINLSYFLGKELTIEDKLFEYDELNYTYEKVYARLCLLKDFLGKDIPFAFELLNHYNYISKRIKAPFSRYEERIEHSFVLLYAKKDEEKPVEFLYSRLASLFKFEVFFTLLFYPILFIVFLFFTPFDSIFVKLSIGIVFFIATYFFWVNATTIIINIKYRFLELGMSILKRPTGAIRRNLNLIDYLYTTSYFHRPFFILLYLTFVASFGGKITKFKPKGFSGGSFGGGGAGGSW